MRRYNFVPTTCTDEEIIDLMIKGCDVTKEKFFSIFGEEKTLIPFINGIRRGKWVDVCPFTIVEGDPNLDEHCTIWTPYIKAEEQREQNGKWRSSVKFKGKGSFPWMTLTGSVDVIDDRTELTLFPEPEMDVMEIFKNANPDDWIGIEWRSFFSEGITYRKKHIDSVLCTR